MTGDAGAVIDAAILLCRDVLLGRKDVAGLGVTDSVAMLRKLWAMRTQTKALAIEDRVALAALAAEVSRGMAGSRSHETVAATKHDLEEVFG